MLSRKGRVLSLQPSKGDGARRIHRFHELAVLKTHHVVLRK
jgi:hypothetical protein